MEKELIDGVNAKICHCCKKLLALADYAKDRRNKKDGLQLKCKACDRDYRLKHKVRCNSYKAAHYQANKAHYDAYKAEYVRLNKERVREYHRQYQKANKEHITRLAKLYNKNHRGKLNAVSARRRVALLKRTPDWLTDADWVCIEDFYILAKALSEATGDNYHVDHIIPLQGELVSGLHVPSNLQILTAFENLSKGNKFNPEEFNNGYS